MGTTKGGEDTAVGRDVLTAMGLPPKGPTFMGTDNLSNALVGGNAGSAKGSRHFLKRYYNYLQRVKLGEVVLKHVPDAHNPADFLTKWVGSSKFRESVNYATNMRAAVAR